MAPGLPKNSGLDFSRCASSASSASAVDTRRSVVVPDAEAEEQARASLADPDCVGGAIAVALRKELLYLWANTDLASVEMRSLDAIVAQLTPPLVRSFVQMANARVPGLGVQALSPLPAAPARAASVGLGSHMSELLEDLQDTLRSLDLVGNQGADAKNVLLQVSAKMPDSHPWQRWLTGSCVFLLPADSILGICMVSATVLLARNVEEDSQILPPEASRPFDEGYGSTNPLYEKDALPAGAPQGLARAIRCRKRVFALERELVARERAEQEKEAYWKATQGKAEARLMEANRQLEERLKAKTEDVKRSGLKLTEAQKGTEEARREADEKKREIVQIKYQLTQEKADVTEAQRRENEHNRALLRAAARENLAKEKSRARAEKLAKCLEGSGKALTEVLAASPDLASQPSSLIQELEADFALKMQHKKEQFDGKLDDFQRQIQKKRQEYNEIDRRIKESHCSNHPRADALGATSATPVTACG